MHNPYDTKQDDGLKTHPSGGEASYDTYRDEESYYPSHRSFQPSEDIQDASLVHNAAKPGGFRDLGMLFYLWRVEPYKYLFRLRGARSNQQS